VTLIFKEIAQGEGLNLNLETKNLRPHALAPLTKTTHPHILLSEGRNSIQLSTLITLERQSKLVKIPSSCVVVNHNTNL
jgi:hypothetical protein